MPKSLIFFIVSFVPLGILRHRSVSLSLSNLVNWKGNKNISRVAVGDQTYFDFTEFYKKDYNTLILFYFLPF